MTKCDFGVARFGAIAALIAASVTPVIAANYSVTAIPDTYWGGQDLWHPSGDDVIGNATEFNTTSADVARTNVVPGSNDLLITIHTNYASHGGAEGTGFGSLFLGPGATIPAGAASNTDIFYNPASLGSGTPDRFSYVVTMPAAPSTTTGNGNLYALNGDGSDVQLSYYPTTSQITNPPNAIFRNYQAVDYSGSNLPLNYLATWTIDALNNTITFLIKTKMASWVAILSWPGP